MNSLQNLNFDKICSIYSKYFDLGYLGTDITNKFACIALVCRVTYELNKKGLYQVGLQILKKCEIINELNNEMLNILFKPSSSNTGKIYFLSTASS